MSDMLLSGASMTEEYCVFFYSFDINSSFAFVVIY